MDYQDIFIKYLNKFTSNNTVIADIGCGDNRYLNLIDSKMAVGIDIEVPEKLQNSYFVMSDVGTIPLKDSSFDVAISRMVLEHLENPQETMEEIYRILSDNGIFLFVTPHRYYPFSLAAMIVKSNHYKGSFTGNRVYSTYYQFNTMKKIRSVLNSIGFKELVLVKTYDPIVFNSKILEVPVRLFNRVYNSGFSRLLPPHHLIGVYRKVEQVADF